MKVSIIMPVYCAEKYLEDAVLSVLNQDFDSFELITIDDGSKDHSLKILHQIAEQYDNLIVVHQDNAGICAARNHGLDLAQGDYVGFCDNDDLYLPGLIKDNYELASSSKADLVRYGRVKYEISNSANIKKEISKMPAISIGKENFITHYKAVRGAHTVWTGLYRKSIIDRFHIRFDEEVKYGGEDSRFNLRFLQHCSRIACNPKAYYQWMHREKHSTSQTFHVEFLEDYRKSLYEELNFVKSVDTEKADYIEVYYVIINYYVSFVMNYLNLPSCPLSFKQQIEVLKKYREHDFFQFLFQKKIGIRKILRVSPYFALIGSMFRWRLLYGELLLYKCARKIFA